MEISRADDGVNILLERGPGAPRDKDGAFDETKALTILQETAGIMTHARREDNLLTVEHNDGRTTLGEWAKQVAASERLSMDNEQFHALTSLARVAVSSCHAVPKEALIDPNNAAAARVIHALYEEYRKADGTHAPAWGKK